MITQLKQLFIGVITKTSVKIPPNTISREDNQQLPDGDFHAKSANYFVSIAYISTGISSQNIKMLTVKTSNL